MPGLTGFVGIPGISDERALLIEMVAALNQEDGDRSSAAIEAESHTYVGWTRHQAAQHSVLPVESADGQIALYFTGEILPSPEGWDSVHAYGSEVIRQYRQIGESVFNGLNGFFAGLLVDRRAALTFLFNDRYGMQRLFWHQKNGLCFFSSEAKAILAAVPSCREFDVTGLAELVTTGCTVGAHSLYKNVEVLPGGSLIVFSSGHLLRRHVYCDVRTWNQDDPGTAEQAITRFIEHFPAVVRNYVAGGDVALSLTGGLDSRMVLSASAAKPGTMKCFSFGSMYRDTFDVDVARRAAAIARQPHTTLVLGSDFTAQLDHYIERAVVVSDGYLGAGGAAELYLNGLVRQIASVRVTGNYGGELLRGVRAFKWSAPRPGLFDHEFVAIAAQTKARFDDFTSLSPSAFAAFHQAPHQDFGRFAIESSQLIQRTPFMDNGLVNLLAPPLQRVNGAAAAFQIIADANTELLSLPTDRGYLLRGRDRIRTTQWLTRQALFKLEYYANSGMPDWLVRSHRLRRLTGFERRVLGRHKFDHFRIWLTDYLQGFVRDLLLGDRTADLQAYVDRHQLRRLLDDHFAEQANHSKDIDLLVTIALAKKLLLNERCDRQRSITSKTLPVLVNSTASIATG